MFTSHNGLIYSYKRPSLCVSVWSSFYRTCHEPRTVSLRLCTRSRTGVGNQRPGSPAQSSDPAPTGPSAACDWSLVRLAASDWSWHVTCVISPGPAACPPPWARPLCSAHSRPLRSRGSNTGHCHSPVRRSAQEWGPVMRSVVSICHLLVILTPWREEALVHSYTTIWCWSMERGLCIWTRERWHCISTYTQDIYADLQLKKATLPLVTLWSLGWVVMKGIKE